MAEPSSPTPPPRRRASDRGRGALPRQHASRAAPASPRWSPRWSGLLVAGQPFDRAGARLPRRVRPLRAGRPPISPSSWRWCSSSTRNIVKLVVERRGALPFARFRAKLVAVLLAMTLVPALLVLDRRQRADSQQRGPLVRRADGRGAGVGQRHRRRLLPAAAGARRRACGAAGARGWRRSTWLPPTAAVVQAALAADVPPDHVELVEVFASISGRRRLGDRVLVARGAGRRQADRRRRGASRRWPSAPSASGSRCATVERGADGAELMRVARRRFARHADGPVLGVGGRQRLLPATWRRAPAA